MLDPKIWTQDFLEQYSADSRQFIGVREISLNGMRALHVYNAIGLEFTVLPDRGFDIWDARYKGIPLTWLAPGSPFPPDWGADWLRQFNGGLLTTCGLTHVGPPETDDLTGEKSGIHGTYTRLRSGNVLTGDSREKREADQHNDYEIAFTATVADSALFGAQLSLRRRYSIRLSSPDIDIADTITNLGDAPAPFMLLYHFNLGFPLIHEGAQLHAPGRVYARDAAAAAGHRTWHTYAAPAPRYAEQVFYHHLRQSEDGMAGVLIGGAALALHLTWETASLPYFTQWKNTRQRQYVNGIEPGNCIPEGRSSARQSGRLKMLEPGESVETHLRLTILDSAEEIAPKRARIDALKADAPLISACNLDGFAPYEE